MRKETLLLTPVTAVWLLTAVPTPAAQPAASPASSNASLTLRLKYVKGQKKRYRVRMAGAYRVAISEMPAPMRSQMRQEAVQESLVERVEPNGTATLRYTTISGSMTITQDGRTSTTPAPKSTDRERVSPLGKRLTKSKPEDAAGLGGFNMESALDLQYPARHLRVGDTWSWTVDAPPIPGAKAVRMNARLVSRQPYQGRPAVQIEVTSTAPYSAAAATPGDVPAGTAAETGAAEGVMTQKVLFNVDPVTGFPWSAVGAVTATMRASGPSPAGGSPMEYTMAMKLNMTVERLS